MGGHRTHLAAHSAVRSSASVCCKTRMTAWRRHPGGETQRISLTLSALVAVLAPQVAHVLLLVEPTRFGLADLVVDRLRLRQHLAAFFTLTAVFAEKFPRRAHRCRQSRRDDLASARRPGTRGRGPQPCLGPRV